MNENTTNEPEKEYDTVPPALDRDHPVTRTAVDLEKEAKNIELNEKLAAIESSETNPVAVDDSTSAEPVAAASLAESVQLTPSIKRSHKGRIISLVSVVAVIVLAAGGTAGWYFGIRTPDTQYEKAAAIVDTLLANAKGIESARSSVKGSSSASVTTASIRLTDDSDTDFAASLDKIKDAKAKAADYMASLEDLKKSTIVTDDASVNALYEANKKTIQEFGASADTLYKTGLVFMTMFERCFSGGELSDVSALKDVDEYDMQIKQCEDYIKANPTVVAGDFSRSVYEPYREVLTKLIANTRTLFTAKAGSTAYLQAIKNLNSIGADMKKIDTSRIDEIELTQSPQQKLTQLKAKIDERKKVLFR